jgi:protein-tyrosine-phosphatase
MRQRVLFLCTGNSARSQMAEAFLRKYAGDLFEVHSAGLNPKDVNPLTIRVMHEIGINISNQRSKGVEFYLGKRSSTISLPSAMMRMKTVPPRGPGFIHGCTGPLKTRLHS